MRGGVPEVIVTIWSNDGCETSHMFALPQLSLFSEYCWKGEACTKDDIWSMSRFTTGMTEELEPELIRGQKCKWLSANDFMYIHTM